MWQVHNLYWLPSGGLQTSQLLSSWSSSIGIWLKGLRVPLLYKSPSSAWGASLSTHSTYIGQGTNWRDAQFVSRWRQLLWGKLWMSDLDPVLHFLDYGLWRSCRQLLWTTQGHPQIFRWAHLVVTPYYIIILFLLLEPQNICIECFNGT